MKKIVIFILGMVLVSTWGFVAGGADRPSGSKPPQTPELLQKGKVTYFKRCSFCHGLQGDGDGPAAHQLIPRPRDFTMGLYKFRTTQSGELPTDEDLFRTISRGLPGTAMQSFDSDRIKNGLSEEERWAVIAYIKTFSDSFSDPELDPVKNKMVVALSKRIPSSAESIEKGKKIFQEMKCWECHGEGGRGNGPNSPRLKDKFRGDPILPFDLTKGWRYKAGNNPEDIYMRFSTGLNGTPMPSFFDSLNDEERWHLANYVVSLQKREVKEEVVLEAKFTKGDLPLDPDAEAWKNAEEIDVRLAGQTTVHPRWENHSVDLVTVKALYNAKEIAFLMTWGDRFQDSVHKPELEYRVPDTYPGYVSWEDIPRDLDNFTDAMAIQFPLSVPEGAKKPHFLRGDPNQPVNLWLWKADREAQGMPALEEGIGRGFKDPFTAQGKDGQQGVGKGSWKEGKWRVVVKRALVTPDKDDIQFVRGKYLPFSLNVWDGAVGEHGLIMALSSWYYVFLEESTPVRVYAFTALGVLLAGLGEFWMVRRVKNGKKG